MKSKTWKKKDLKYQTDNFQSAWKKQKSVWKLKSARDGILKSNVPLDAD